MKSSHAPIVGALIILIVLVIAVPLATSEHLPISTSVSVVGKHLQGPLESAYVFVYVTNKAPFGTIPFRGVREDLGNVLTIERIDTKVTVDKAPYFSFSQAATTSITFEPPYDSVTRTITTTPARPPYAGRFSPVVLPGETVAVYYTSWAVECGDPAGVYEWTFTVHAAFQGSPIVLTDSGKFTVKQQTSACVGISVRSGSGGAVAGAGITLTDLDTNMEIATSLTDSLGNCLFYASDVPLVTDHSYKVEVTSLPPPFTQVTPDPPTFTWDGSSQYFVFTAT